MSTTTATQTLAKPKIGARQIAVTGMLGAVAIILQFFEFVIPIMPSFIKLDLSDLPGLMGAFALGPWYGVAICLIKNIFHLATSSSALVGELCNFLLGASFVLPAGYIYKFNKTKKGALIGATVGALCMALFSFPSNLFVTYPMYINLYGMSEDAILGMYQAILPSMKSLPQCLLVFNLPFTFVKGMISVAITLLIYKPLSPILHGREK
ncbi:MAG: ECF transporter S component [Lachnospiraceae bacterium]|nr:ECF transporter S component [Lachnospiraceae bacterium]